MMIVVNGEAKDLPEGLNVQMLVERLGLAKAACAAEVNKKLVPKRERENVTLHDGDIVEVVTLVGGG